MTKAELVTQVALKTKLTKQQTAEARLNPELAPSSS